MCNYKRGFTLVEIIIVVAIISIIGAIIVPNFIGSTEKAALKSDIQSARTIQYAIDLCIAETKSDPLNINEIGDTTSLTLDQADESALKVIATLEKRAYLSSNTPGPQTEGAKWAYDSTARTIQLDLSSDKANVKTSGAIKNVQLTDQKYIKGVDFALFAE